MGDAVGVVVERGGVELVIQNGTVVAFSGSILSNVRVTSGGEIVYAGGSFVNLTVGSGASEEVASGGALSNIAGVSVQSGASSPSKAAR